MMFRRFRRVAEEEVIGFALSGGGSRGSSQVGSLRALEEAQIWPDVVTGTSAGAINACWVAMYSHRLDELEAIWMGLRKADVFPGSPFQVLFNLTRHGYLHSSAHWETFLRSHMGSICFEDLRIPCAVVAVRLSDGERVVFDSGPLLPAVMASIAIPGVFPPYRIDDELYVDGGVLEHLPVPALLERGATTIYALDCSGFLPSSPALSVIDRCSRIGATASARAVTSLGATRGRTIHLLRPELPECIDARDFHQTADLIRAGYDQARAYLTEQLGGTLVKVSVRNTPAIDRRTAG